MKIKLFKILGSFACAVSLIITSCSDDNQQEIIDQENAEVQTADLEVSQEIIDKVKALDLNDNFVKWDDFYFPDGTSEKRIFIEEDIAVTESELDALLALKKTSKNSKEASDSKQYTTSNLVSQGKTISIIGYTGGSQALTSNEQTALQWAVDNYNRLSGVSISFNLTFGTNYQNKDMVVYNNTVNNPNGAGGSAGFPSNGNPYKFVQIYGLSSYNTNVIEHVITHEIGHSVGFRHTDWFSRESCGQNVNEGGDTNHVPNTPTGYDNNSIMLACFSASEDGEFNGNDITALNYMY